MVAPADNPYVTPADLADLRDTIRALNMSIVQLTNVLREVAKHTENLPALTAMLAAQRSNGTMHEETDHG